MAIKIEKISNALVITDLKDGKILYDGIASDHYYKSSDLENYNVITFINLRNGGEVVSDLKKIDFDEARDENNDSFDKTSFLDFCRTQLGT